MRFLNNVKIRTKLLASFLIVVFLTAGMSLFSILDLKKVDTSYSVSITSGQERLANRFEIFRSFSEMRRLNRDSLIDGENSQKLSTTMSSITSIYDSLKKALDNTVSDATIDTAKVKADLDSYYNVCKSVNDNIANGNLSAARSEIEGGGAKLAEELNKALLNSYQAVADSIEEVSTQNSKTTRGTILLLVVLAALITLISIGLALLIATNIAKPVYFLMNAAKEIAAGNLNIRLGSNNRDELASLSNDLGVVVDNIKSLIDDLAQLTVEIDGKGDVDARLNADKFQGAYKEVASGVNKVVAGLTSESSEFVSFVTSYAQGDFSATVQQHVGKKAKMNQAADLLANNLTDLSFQVSALVESASAGDLNTRIDASRFQNGWASLVKGLNNVMEGIVVPVKETINVLEALSQGDLSVTVQGNYKGSYLTMKTAVNSTISVLARYINEISSVLNEMSGQNFDLEIVNDYMGDFAPIKVSLNKIIDNLNFVLDDINASSETVASGARLISESSQSLAQGATEQASSVEQLLSTVETITEQTRKNAEDAKSANTLAIKAKENAAVGNGEMKGMLKAMDDINESSSNISKIIKVIDDIAFQTNLLALNAAVEAARAGQHGKGFAVVADEVRSLAGRSKNAAQETTGLIQGTVEKVNEGTRIANQTALALEATVHDITDISVLIGGIAEASEKQEEVIQQINSGLTQISEVTQSTTATSEEEASSSEELSSQAEVFKQTVAKFKLKKKFAGSTAYSALKSADRQDVAAASYCAPKTPARVPKSTPPRDEEETLYSAPKVPAPSPAPKSTPRQAVGGATYSAPKAPTPSPAPKSTPRQAVGGSAYSAPKASAPAPASKSMPRQAVGGTTGSAAPRPQTPRPANPTAKSASTGASVVNLNTPNADYNRKDYGKY